MFMFRKKIKVGDIVAYDAAFDAQVGEVIAIDGPMLFVAFDNVNHIVLMDMCVRLSEEEYKRWKESKKNGKTRRKGSQGRAL